MSYGGREYGGHLPVLPNQVLEVLAPREDGLYIDATIGGGGHSAQILKAAPNSRLLGMDTDSEALQSAREQLASFGERTHFIHGNFKDIQQLVNLAGFNQVDGILVDLGLSSRQLDCKKRGFSFGGAGKLDMRMNPLKGKSLAQLLSETDHKKLSGHIRNFGEERLANAVARAILREFKQGKLENTLQLAHVVRGVLISKGCKRGKIDLATRTFQALRIWVNDEMGNLDSFLAQAPGLLKKGGRLLVITFHSLEDRRVKRSFNRLAGQCNCPPQFPVCCCGAKKEFNLLNKKGLIADPVEVNANPRARSARLRAVEKVI